MEKGIELGMELEIGGKIKLKKVMENVDGDVLCKLEEKWEDKLMYDLYYEMDLWMVKKSELEEVIGNKIEEEEDSEYGDEDGKVLVVWIEFGLYVIRFCDVCEMVWNGIYGGEK